VPNTPEGPQHPPTLERQLGRGFLALRFEPILEAAYREFQFYSSLGLQRLNLAILIVLVISIVQVDRLVIPGVSDAVPAVVRLGVMVPILALAFGVSFLPRAHIWYPRFMAVFMCVGMAGIAWVGLVAYAQGEDRLFVRMVIATIAVYFIMGLRFRLALVVNLISLVAYVVLAAIWKMPAMALVHFMAMLFMTSVICAAGAYNLEHARRTAWLEGRLLAENAIRDGLTGISNRRRLDDHLERVWQQCQRDHKPMALLFGDLDSFKLYNDHYGHQAGDEALKAVAGVLADYVRRPLDMAARFGGEEFAVVLFETTPEHALRIGLEIKQGVRRLAIPHAHSLVAPMLTISIGIATAQPAPGLNPSRFFLLADQALYAAKRGGRNTVHLLRAEDEK
jgi:diguanylate cyclase (GGDEF)-like protein